jgi:hypothetical protein
VTMTDQTSPLTPVAPEAAEPPARTRNTLLDLHRQARQRRDAAPLGSEAYREAVAEVGELEVEIASIDTGVPPVRS